MMHKVINADFFSTQVYAVLSAMGRELGVEKQREIVQKAGEIIFLEIEKELDFDKKTPASLVESSIQYLEEVGYLEKGKSEILSEDQIVVHMFGASARGAVDKLQEEGFYPPHFLTNIIFAGLKKHFNLQAEIDHLFIGESKDPSFKTHTKEKWTLKPIGNPKKTLQ